MAVFQQNMEMSTLQFKQLQALESLQDSLEDSLKLGDSIYKRIDTFPDTILQSAGIIVKALTEISGHNLEENNYYDSILSSVNSTSRHLEHFTEELEETLERHHRDDQRSQERIPGLFDDLKDSLKDFAREQWNMAAESANEWSRMYNDTIKFIGTDGEASQQFRRDIVTIVDDLNADISRLGDFGAKMDPQKVMETMVAISNSSDISSVDTLKTLTKPILLAQETTNLNTAELAKVGNRFYNRYNFSSAALESMVDNIRNMSEGQNVNEDSLLRLADTVSGYYYKLGFEGDSLENAINNAMADSTFLQANNLDTTKFEEFYELALSNTVESQNALVSALGPFADTFRDAVRSGEGGAGMVWMETLAALAKNPNMLSLGSIGNLGSESDLYAAERALSVLGEGGGTTFDQILESMNEENSATERMEDKYVSIGDQVNNNLKGIASYLSTIQETLGIGMDDITLGVSVLGNVATLLGSRGVLGVLGGGTSSAASGGGILRALISPQGLAIGAGIALLSVAVNGIKAAYDKVNAEKINSLGDLSKGNATEGTEYYWESSMGKDGNVSWSMKSVDTSGFNEEELSKFHQLQEKNAQDYKSYIESKDNLGFWGKTWDWMTGWTTGDAGGALVGTQRGYKTLAEELASYVTDPTYQDMMNYYLSNGFLDTSKNKTLDGFLEHIDEYLGLYNQGKVAEVKKNGSPGATASTVASYDVGTNYVDRDQLAYIHEGEEIVPKKYNPAANMEDLKALMESTDNSRELSEILEVLSGIREYMEYWKRDGDKKSAINSARSLSSTNMRYSKYYSSGPTFV